MRHVTAWRYSGQGSISGQRPPPGRSAGSFIRNKIGGSPKKENIMPTMEVLDNEDAQRIEV